MIFEKRLKQCQECDRKHMCKYSEIYYKNKGEWPIESMAVTINGSSQCKYAKNKY